MSDSNTTATNAIRGGANPSSPISSETKLAQILGQSKVFAISQHEQVSEMTTQSQNQVMKGESQKVSPKSSHIIQDHLMASSNSTPMNVNTNMNTAAQAQNGIFATPVVTAQHLLKGQMGINIQSNGNYQANNNNLATNPGVFNSITPQTTGIQPSSFGMNLNDHTNQYAVLLHMLQQSNQLSTQSQVSQAAAILAASGFGNSMMNSQGQSAPDSTLAAAHAFVMMLNQQHLLGNQSQPQHHMNYDGNSHLKSQQQIMSLSPTQQRIPRVSHNSHKGDATTNDDKESGSSFHESSKIYESSTASSAIGEKRKSTLETNRHSGQQQEDPPHGADNKSSSNSFSSTLLSTLKRASHNSRTPSMTHPQVNQLSLHSLQMPITSMQSSQAGPLHHGPVNIANNRKSIIQPTISPLVLSQMQTWSLNQLESHVQLLRDTNQPIPHAVQILLTEARKIEQKRAAKRIANRKSACTSRARKKALVAEMTNTNAKLRRQAIILSLLPDLVIAIKEDGTITFCSAQVERVLRHKVEDMIGANIDEVLMPSSRIELASLVEKLVAAEKAAFEDIGKEGDESGRSSNSGNIFEAAIVSEQSDHFPLSVVKVKSHNREGGSNGASDSSRNGAANTTMPRVGTQSSLTITNQSNSDNSSNRVCNSGSTGSGTNDARTLRGNGNSDLDSSSSSEPKNLTKANDALNRNVRFHNEQLKIKDAKKTSVSHKDDVTGDSVTANNADARLSSLMKVGPDDAKEMAALEKNKLAVNMEALEDNCSSSSTDSLLAGVEDRQKKRKRQENSASDDSGYRESGESDPSREDSASSTSDASNGRPRPLAPTCNICLIRADQSTIWCEVTSSIRTRSINEEQFDMSTVVTSTSSRKKYQYSEVNSDGQTSTNCSTEDQIKELLLCLRPIQDGTEKVSEDLRFIPKSKKYSQSLNEENIGLTAPTTHRFAEDVYLDSNDIDGKKQDDNESNYGENGNMRNRPTTANEESFDDTIICAIKKQSLERKDDEAEKCVVESLIMMSSN